MTFIDFLYKLDGWVWGTPLIVLIMVVGIYYMVKVSLAIAIMSLSRSKGMK